jgi:hypothetical protein
MNIVVHIERLILDGVPVPQSQRAKLLTAIEAELARLLATGGLAVALLEDGAVVRMPEGVIQLTSDGDPNKLGRQIARAVHIYEGASR